MLARHVLRHLSEYNDDELSGFEKLRVEAHLRTCGKCRKALDEIRFGARLASTLSIIGAPNLSLREVDVPPPVVTRRRLVPVAVLSILFAFVLVIAWYRIHTPQPSWEVSGVPGKSSLHPGEVLQTGSSPDVEVKIANIGQLRMDPNTRIRLLVTQQNEHRIALERGRLEATTWAPPRLFIMETPSATAVDLGCRYTMEVQDDGSSLLHVGLGLVALDRNGSETIVPAGAFCRTRPGSGPGTPYFEDSSALFQAALESVDSFTAGPAGPARNEQLEIVIRESRVRDALSLWDLLPRLDPQSRGHVYDRLAQFMPPPPEVTRDGIVALDPKMLSIWEPLVSQLWQ